VTIKQACRNVVSWLRAHPRLAAEVVIAVALVSWALAQSWQAGAAENRAALADARLEACEAKPCGAAGRPRRK